MILLAAQPNLHKMLPAFFDQFIAMVVRIQC